MTETVPLWDVVLTCERGHVQRIVLQGMPRLMAEDFGQMLDGTSPMFVRPPREFPVEYSTLARCQWKNCGAWFSAYVEEHPDEESPV